MPAISDQNPDQATRNGNAIFAFLTAIVFVVVLIAVERPDVFDVDVTSCRFCVRGEAGYTFFVLAEGKNALKAKRLKDKSLKLCRSTKPYCEVRIWSDPNRIPSGFPLTREQAATEVTRYMVNWESDQDAICLVRNGTLDQKTCR